MEAGKNNATTSANEQRKRAKDEASEEAPRVKRQRVSRACDQCRAGEQVSHSRPIVIHSSQSMPKDLVELPSLGEEPFHHEQA